MNLFSRKCVIPVVCVKIRKVMQSNIAMSIMVYLMAILDNSMFRPLLAIFRLSSRELKVLLYRVSQEECARFREGVPYVKVYRYNPKHLCTKLNGYGDNGQRSSKL